MLFGAFFFALDLLMQNTFVLYGANGYSGELIARFAAAYGLTPILAGRNKKVIKAMADRFSLPFRIASLEDAGALREMLKDQRIVVNAAGPYDITAPPMIRACLDTGAHYVDLNGDSDVFELLQRNSDEAIAANIMILPGAGFDVVPTDCLAYWLKQQLPDASHLELAFVILGSGLSRGTAITTLQKLGMPGAIRREGKLVPEPVGRRGRWIDFPAWHKKSFMMSIPWGDISTAYFSTGIPNIITYTGVSKGLWLFLKGQGLYNSLLRTPLMHRIIRRIINSRAPGPPDRVREKAMSLVWGWVTNPSGQTLTARMKCPEAYTLTAHSVLLVAVKVLAGNFKAGYQTPASAYGAGLVLEIDGVVRDSTPVSGSG